MAISITLAGIDRTAFVDLKSVDITDTIVGNADTLAMDVSVSTTDGWNPKSGNQVVITNGTGKEFGGIVEEIYETEISPSRLHYTLNCRDYTYLFDKYLVVDESTAALASSAWVTRIINSFTTGFTGTNVMAGPVISAIKFDYIAASEAVRSIADKVGYGWYIDYDKDVHFFAAATLAAPVASINLDTDTTNYGGLKLRETVSGAKSRIYMKDYKHATTVQWNRSFVGDGGTRFFLLGQEPASISPSQITATLNGTALDLLTDFVDGQPGSTVGSSSQLFICFDNFGARTSSGVSAFTSTQTLSVTFNYMEDTVTQVEDAAAEAVLAAREGGDGVHEYVISDAQMTASDGSDDLALLQGNLALSRYANPRLTGTFNSFTQGWRAGQSLTLSSTRRMGTLNKTVTVQQVNKRIVSHPGTTGTPTFQSTIDFADGVIGI